MSYESRKRRKHMQRYFEGLASLTPEEHERHMGSKSLLWDAAYGPDRREDSHKSIDDKITIEELSASRLEEAIALVDKVFPPALQGSEKAREGLSASLDREKYSEQIKSWGIGDVLKYYVAVKDNKVIAISGVYTYRQDENEAAWIGWTCSDPEKRMGAGRLVVNHVIEEIRKMGKDYARLYTTDSEIVRSGRKMWDELKFVVYHEKPFDADPSFKEYFMQLRLEK